MIPEDELRGLGAVPHHAGQVQVVPLLKENVGAAENLRDRLCEEIINNLPTILVVDGLKCEDLKFNKLGLYHLVENKEIK